MIDKVRAEARRLLSTAALTAPELHQALASKGLSVAPDVLRRWLDEDLEAGILRRGGPGERWESTRTVLMWDKPPRAVPYEEWVSYQADSAPPGTYVPNMPREWKLRWKAKMAGQRSEGFTSLRVEIRKTVTGSGHACAQVLIVVYDDGRVRISMNGTGEFSRGEYLELGQAVTEARMSMEAFKAAAQERKQA